MQKNETEIHLKFVGIDDWSRPVYRNIHNMHQFFGDVNNLFPDKKIAPNNTVKEINIFYRHNLENLCYFGNYFGCEPMGTTPTRKLIILD